MLQERIHINHVIRDRLKNSIEQSKGKILESITPEEFHLVEKIHENSYKKSFELTKKRHMRKLNELINKNKVTQSATNITDKKKWVINMSSRQLTHIETYLLAKGLNFSITSKTLPNKDIIATVEDAVKDLEKEEADTIRAKVSLTLQNSKPLKDNLSKDERKALKELQSDIRCILRSHKIRLTFYTEMTLRKLLCKPKDRVATEDKNNIVYEIDCSNCQAVYFGESKRL